MKELKLWLEKGHTTISNLLLDHAQKIGLNMAETLFLIHLQRELEQGQGFPSLSRISKKLNVTVSNTSNLLQQLIQRKYLEIDTMTDEEGKIYDRMNFELLYQRLIEAESRISNNDLVEEQEDINSFDGIRKMLESEFGRPLSPIEMETINYWIVDEKYQFELIRAALREAVLNQAYSLRYIERILQNWKMKNIRSIHDIEREKKKHEESKVPSTKNEDRTIHREVPIFNWLNDEEN